jgi:hypothetical protein
MFVDVAWLGSYIVRSLAFVRVNVGCIPCFLGYSLFRFHFLALLWCDRPCTTRVTNHLTWLTCYPGNNPGGVDIPSVANECTGCTEVRCGVGARVSGRLLQQ